VTVATPTPGKGYGDLTTPSRFWEIDAESLKLDIDQLTSFAMRAGSYYQRADRRRQGLRRAGGDIEMPVLGRGFGFWLKQIFGKAAVITTPAGGTTSRDHTFTFGDGWQIGTTIQVGRPDIQSDAANVNPYTYRGCKVVDAEFKLAVGEWLTVKLGIDARDEEQSTALAAASYVVTGTKVLDWQGSAFRIGGALVEGIDTVTLKITRKVKDDRYQHGSTLKRQPIVNDAFEVVFEIEGEYLDPVLYNRYASEPTTLPGVTWAIDGDAIEAITGGTAYFGLLWTAPAVVTTGETPNADGPDVLGQKLAMTAVWDGTNELLTGRYRSTDTTS